MIVRKGEVITIASGIFEGYDRAGPFVATQDIDVDAIVADAVARIEKPWELRGVLSEIPKQLYERGLIEKLSCRRIYLGGLSDVDIREEADEAWEV